MHHVVFAIIFSIRYLKGKSSLVRFDRYANLKYKYGNSTFWARGQYAETVVR